MIVTFLRRLKGNMNKSFLFLYRVTAIVVLYGVLLGVGGYLFLQGFYLVNHSWIVPSIVSPSNDAVLQMTSQMVTNKQMLETLTLDRNRLQESLDSMKAQRLALIRLDSDLSTAYQRKNQEDATAGGDLKALIQQKRQDITKTRPVMNDVATVEDRISKDLEAGLITKGDAAIERASLTQLANTYTDNRVAEVLLRDNVRQKTTKDIDSLEILSKQADLKSQIVQAAINISIGEQQLTSDQKQIDGLVKAMRQIDQSPFYMAVQAEDDVKFAFVPYDNEQGVEVGDPVYDCYLNMIGCRQVGTIKVMFSDEQKVTHPLFKTEVRGFMVQLDLTELDSAKSKTLFVGHKPLFI
jgi:hypothetical protein